jgi:hypothetical protein
MAVESLREALRLLGTTPALWVPGVVAGASASILWILLNIAGAFFTSRILILAALLLTLFVIGMVVLIREKGGDVRDLVHGGIRYYFRVLLPGLVIVFMILVIFILLAVTFGLTGTTPDPGFLGLMTVCVMVPTLMLTFFFDMAAVFEDRKVFEAIQRSTVLVSENVMEAAGFFLVLLLSCTVILFSLMFAWEIALYEKLAPLAEYNQTQIQSFTYEQLAGMIAPDGIWITAVFFLIGGLVLIPFFFTFKACFYRKLAGGSPAQAMIGEYDSKGRWYKY